MKKSLFVASLCAALLLPAVTLAQDNLGPSANLPTQNTTSSQTVQPVDASQGQSLQSANASQGGIQQPATDQQLQSAGSSAQISQFLAGEADTSKSQPKSPATWQWLGALAIVLGAIGLGLLPQQPSGKPKAT